MTCTQSRFFADIKDMENYDAGKANNAQLSNDWRLVLAYYSTLKDPKKKIKFTEGLLLETGSKILAEMINRISSEKMKHRFQLEEMTELSREFFNKIKKKLPKKQKKWLQKQTDTPEEKPELDGLYLTPPHPELMWKGEKTLIIKSKEFDILDKEYNLICNTQAFGIIKITSIAEINEEDYDTLKGKHKISDEEKKNWGKKYSSWKTAPYYAYTFDWIEKYKTPKQVTKKKGIQVFAKPSSYRIKDSIPSLPTAGNLKPFVWIPDFISLTGSVAYQNREPNDVDLVVKAFQDDLGLFLYLDPSINLKISRIMESLYPGKDVEWISTPFGANWSHAPLYDLVLVPKPEVVVRQIEEAEFRAVFYDSRKLKPFTFVKILKPMHGRIKGEEYSIDALLEVIDSRKEDWYKTKISVEKKFDGDAVSVHKEEGKVIILTSEGRDISSKLPTLISQLEKINHSFLIMGEIEHWEGAEHSPRQLTTAIIHKKATDPREKDVHLNIYDLLYWDGKDIHNEPFYTRLVPLKEVSESANIKKSKMIIVDNKEELKEAVEHYTQQPGSEGAFLKKLDFVYELDGATRFNLKYKATSSIDVKVVSIHKVKDAEAWNYLTTLQDGTPCGNTYNSSLEAKVGSVITVEFMELNQYEDPDSGKIYFNFWSPSVRNIREAKTADNVETAKKLVEASGGTSSKKKWPKRYNFDLDPYLSSPEEDKTWEGMMQFDLRGEAVHIDFRVQTDGNHLLTWTLFVPQGASASPSDPKAAKALLTKEILPTVKEILDDPMKKFNCRKEKEIFALPDVFKKGELGYGPGEKYQPRYMWSFDVFEIEHGCKKPDFMELFISKGEHLNGRVVFVKIENKEEWTKTPEGPMTWMMFATKEQKPYVLSSRAIKKKWIPAKNHSALPKSIRNQIPEEYHYWKAKGEDARRKLRDELVEAMKKEIEIKFEGDAIPLIFSDVKLANKPGKFILQKQTWKGPKIVRAEASRTEYHLLLKVGDKIDDFVSDEPLPSAGLMGKGSKTRWEAEGDIPPKTRLNTTKNTPSKIKVIDKGTFMWLTDAKTMLRLKGKKLKGTYVIPKEKGEKIRTLKRISKGGD